MPTKKPSASDVFPGDGTLPLSRAMARAVKRAEPAGIEIRAGVWWYPERCPVCRGHEYRASGARLICIRCEKGV